jgi:hypothetical protein
MALRAGSYEATYAVRAVRQHHRTSRRIPHQDRRFLLHAPARRDPAGRRRGRPLPARRPGRSRLNHEHAPSIGQPSWCARPSVWDGHDQLDRDGVAVVKVLGAAYRVLAHRGNLCAWWAGVGPENPVLASPRRITDARDEDEE